MITHDTVTRRLHQLKSTVKFIDETNSDTLTLDHASQMFIQWYSNLDHQCDILFARVPLQVSDIQLFDMSGCVGIYHTSLIILALEQVDTSALSSEMLTNLEKIVQPPIYEFGTPKFKIDEPDQHVLCSQMQFTSNFDAYQLVQDAEKILQRASRVRVINHDPLLQEKVVLYTGGNVALYREADIMFGFATRYVSQPRLLPIPKLIQYIFETSNFPVRGFPFTQNPILQVLKILLRSSITFPFTEKSGEMTYHSRVSMSTPHLCYALSQLWTQYLLNDISQNELQMIVQTYVELSTTSFDTFVLDFKDLRINSSKVLVELVQHADVPIYGHCAPAGVSEVKEPSDIWRDGERDKFGKDFVAMCPKPLYEYLKSVGVLTENGFTASRIFKDDSEARRIHQLITFATQPGLFIKNPVILTMDKSINPRSSFGIGYDIEQEMVNPSDNSDRHPLTYRWHGETLQAMSDEVLRFLPRYLDVLRNSDLHQEFIRCMTNNSGGVPYEPSEEEKASVPSGILRSLGRKRLMFFLFNPTIFTTYSEWKRAVETITSSGERKQVDRRGRVIQMVSNAAQLSAFLLFLITDTIGGSEEEFKSKKNSGTITDMLFLLTHTALPGYAYECADVKGMDAATTKLLCAFTSEIVVRAFKDHPGETYFWAQSKDWDIVVDGNVVRRERIAAPIELMRACEQFADTTFFRLKEPETFGHVMTSPDAFPSGKFSTNSQHSLVNKTAVTSWARTFNAKMLQLVRERGVSNPHQSEALVVNSLVSGDDLTVRINYGGQSTDVLLAFSEGLQRWYTNIGLTLDSVLSTNSATFLQLTSILGKPWPKPDRISITTSEHGDAMKVEFVEAMSEILDVLRELSGRSAYPSNWVPIAVCFSNQLRYIRVVLEKGASSSLENASYLMKRGRSVYIRVPFFCLFVRNGLSLPYFATEFNQYVPRQLSYTPRGMISDYHLRRILLRPGVSHTMNSDVTTLLCKFYEHCTQRLSVSSKLMSVRKFEELEEQFLRELYGTPADWYDTALATTLELDLIEHILSFDPKSRVKLARRRLVPAKDRKKWASSLASQLDFQALTKSAIAHVALTELRYNVPSEIAFHNSPNERVNQAIESLPGTHEEFIALRRSLLEHVQSYIPGARWIQAPNVEAMFLFEITELDEEYDVTRDAVIDDILSFMPASKLDFDRSLVVSRFGFNFFDQVVTFEGYYGYKPGPWKEYNHKELVRFAAHVWHTNHEHLPYVWHLANIQGVHRRTLSRMIRVMDTSLSSPWKSIIHTRQFFEIGRSSLITARCVDLTLLRRYEVRTLGMMICRDFLLSYYHTGFQKIRFNPHPLFIRAIDGIHERNVLLKSLAMRLSGDDAK